MAIETRQNRTGMVFILFAIICAVIAGALVFLAGLKIAPTVPALVAVQEIQAGDLLTKEMFKETKLAKAGLPGEIISPNTDLSRFIARYGMSQGDILRKPGVIDKNDSSASLLSARLTVQKDPTLRAVEVPVEAAAGMLSGMKAGDKVDIISVGVTDEEGAKKTISKTIIENAKVVGINPPGESSSGTLVIAVNKKQAEIFFLARTKDKVYASLHPFGRGE
jgi:Flp pilus assembly protein CpaB